MAKKKKRQRKTVTERLAEDLELPKDVLCDLSKIEIVGEHDVTIENFRGIIEYEPELLRVNTKCSVVTIMGAYLEISAISDEQVSVRGNIKSLEFDK